MFSFLSVWFLGQEDDEARDNNEFHAGAEAGHQEDPVGHQFPDAAGQVLEVLAVVLLHLLLLPALLPGATSLDNKMD